MSESWRGSRADILKPSETLLLRAAGLLVPDLAWAAWRAFRARVKEGDEHIVEQRLLPMVCRNLLRLGHPQDPYLARAYAQSFGANARILGQTGPALLALHTASIPTMVLKGAALLQVHYQDLGARPMSDVDVLVPEGQIGQALDALAAMGWRTDPTHRWLDSESHAEPVSSPSGLSVDMHRHATYEARFNSADQAFFKDSVPIEISGARTSAMSASDQLLHTIVHGLRWSIARSPIWLIDALTILRGGGVDVEKTIERASRLRLRAPLRQGLEMVRQVFGDQETLDALLSDLPSQTMRARERVEQWFRVREPAGPLGAIPNLWFAYSRSEPDGHPPILGFPGFLSKVWRLDPKTSLGGLLARKAWRRLRPRF